VCGMTINSATAKQRADHAGHRYFFCSAKCRERFTADPDRYLTAPRAEMPAARSAAPGEVLWTCPMHPQIVRKEPGFAVDSFKSLSGNIMSQSTLQSAG
jgi:Cu+-exporting ATPase